MNLIITSLDSFTVNGNPTFDSELTDKKYVDNSIGEGNILRIEQTLKNYLKGSVGDNL